MTVHLLLGFAIGAVVGPAVLIAYAVGEREVRRLRVAGRLPVHRAYERAVLRPVPLTPPGRRRTRGPSGVPAAGRPPLDLHPLLLDADGEALGPLVRYPSGWYPRGSEPADAHDRAVT